MTLFLSFQWPWKAVRPRGLDMQDPSALMSARPLLLVSRSLPHLAFLPLPFEPPGTSFAAAAPPSVALFVRSARGARSSTASSPAGPPTSGGSSCCGASSGAPGLAELGRQVPAMVVGFRFSPSSPSRPPRTTSPGGARPRPSGRLIAVPRSYPPDRTPIAIAIAIFPRNAPFTWGNTILGWIRST